MKLTITKKIECNKYSVIIKFKEFGSKTLTPEEEMQVINDYCPKFKLSDISFEGRYKTDDSNPNKIIATKDGSSGDAVSLQTSNKAIAINEDLECEYVFYSNDVKKNEIKTSLKDVDLVAKAKIQLFIDKFVEKLENTLAELGKKLDSDYEEETEVELG